MPVYFIDSDSVIHDVRDCQCEVSKEHRKDGSTEYTVETVDDDGAVTGTYVGYQKICDLLNVIKQ